MSSSRFLPHQRGLGDEVRGVHHVLFLGRARRQQRRDVLEPLDAVAQPLRVAVDARVVPHQLADAVDGDLGRPAVAQRRHGPRRQSGRSSEPRGRDDVARDTFREHEPLEQRVRRKAVRAVHARAAHLAAGVEPFDGGTAGEVGHHAAHHVVRGRGDGNAVLPRIDAARAADGEDSGKAARKRAGNFSRVEIDARTALPLPENLTGDDVARRELGQAMPARHESHTAIVHENRALAAHRLRNQLQRVLGRVERGGVELHEFHVGQSCARTVRDRVAVAGRDLGVRGVPVELPAPAGREHRRVGDDLHGAARDTRLHAGAASVHDDEVQRACALEHRDVRAVAHALDQRSRDLRAGLVAVRVHDPLARVRGLLAEREPAGRVGVEPRADRRELPHALRPLGDEHLHGRRVAQRGSSRQRVEPVEFRRVTGAERRGDAALRVRGGAVE